MDHFEGTFKGVRDLRIYHQSWLPEENCKAAVLIVHGLGEHSGRYTNVVNHLVPLGYAVYGFDLPGHGKSEGDREYVERFNDFYITLSAYLEVIKAEQIGKPLFLLGHSMGGTIATEYLMTHQNTFKGAIISAPTIIIPDHINQITIIGGKILSKIAPKVGVLPLDPKTVSRDPEVVQAYIDDPLVFHGKTSARLADEFLGAMMRINNGMERINAPVMILQGMEDKLVNPQGSQLLYDRVSSEEKTLKRYVGLHHEIFNEPEHELVLNDLCAWLDAHM
jgi:acylglycerol lipase